MSEDYKEIIVRFLLDDEQIAQLEEIVEEFKKNDEDNEFPDFDIKNAIRISVFDSLNRREINKKMEEDRKKEEAKKKEVYTMEHWRADRTFNARPGQEITGEIYEEMLNCMPPLKIPPRTVFDSMLPITAGFLMGEPTSSDKEGNLYSAFGMYSDEKEEHFYYLGLSHAGR